MSLVAAASAHLESRYTLVLLTYLGTCAVLVVTNVVRALSFGGGADAATRAKWLVLAAMSLGATWYYMFAFLARSYSDYANGIVFKACSPAWSAKCAPTVAAWLRDTRLFEQAWGYVVSGATQWWWSSEVCLLAVGAWIVKGREEAALGRLPNLFLLMLLGQAVAVSVALCLTFLTLSQTSSVSFRPTQPGSLFVVEMMLMAAGAYSVTEPPTTLLRLAAMHAPPLLLSMLPARVVRRKVLYGFLFAYSLMIRYNLTLDIYAALPASAGLFETLRQTLWSHPAQSSIGLDNVCSCVAVAAYVLQERAERKAPQSTAWILALLTPVLGPSAVLAAWGGLRSMDREIFVGPDAAAAGAVEKKAQ